MVLIIYAHPGTDGHCSYLLEQVKKHVKNYEIIDLYDLKYDPVLWADEHYTAGNRTVSKQNKEFQEKISKAKKLIFIYPVWWNSMPAMMKGFLDRVFVARFAYKYVNGLPKGLLTGKKAAVFITHGGPNFVSTLMFGDRAGKIIAKDALGFVGIKAKFFKIGGCTKFTDKQKKKIEKIVKKGLKYLS